MNHKRYYLNNKYYSNILESQSLINYQQYLKSLGMDSKTILDVGCGTGIVVDFLQKKGKTCYGVDVSKTSIKIAKNKKKGKFILIEKETLPFENRYFDAVGSFNVIEHVDSPKQLIEEMIRVLKKNGKITIACPNFLSITNNYHPRVSGFYNKTKNIFTVLKKLCFILFSIYTPKFERMKPISNKKFKPDNDAINVTNPIDIIELLKRNKIKIIYFSGDSRGDKKILLNRIPFFRLFFGSMFIIGVKYE